MEGFSGHQISECHARMVEVRRWDGMGEDGIGSNGDSVEPNYPKQCTCVSVYKADAAEVRAVLREQHTVLRATARQPT